MFGFLHVFHLVSDDSVLSIKVPKCRRTAYAFKTDKIGDAVVWRIYVHLCAQVPEYAGTQGGGQHTVQHYLLLTLKPEHIEKLFTR